MGEHDNSDDDNDTHYNADKQNNTNEDSNDDAHDDGASHMYWLVVLTMTKMRATKHTEHD